MPRRQHCGSYIVSVFENIPKNLLVQGRVQLEHISHIMIGVEATYILRLQPLTYIEGNNQTSSPIWNYVTGNLTS